MIIIRYQNDLAHGENTRKVQIKLTYNKTSPWTTVPSRLLRKKNTIQSDSRGEMAKTWIFNFPDGWVEVFRLVIIVPSLSSDWSVVVRCKYVVQSRRVRTRPRIALCTLMPRLHFYQPQVSCEVSIAPLPSHSIPPSITRTFQCSLLSWGINSGPFPLPCFPLCHSCPPISWIRPSLSAPEMWWCLCPLLLEEL